MAEGELGQIAERTKKELSKLTGLEASSLIGISNDGGETTVKLEMIEKKSIPDSQDVLGTYEVKLDPEGKIKGFTRTKLRRRGDTAIEE